MKEKRKERFVAFNRAIILEAAHKLFLKKGINGTTMDDISREAECSKTTVYSYFKSKDDLVNYLFFEGLTFYQERIRAEAEKSQNFKDFYTRVCHTVVTMHQQQPIYYEGVTGKAIFDENALPEDILNKMYVSGETGMATIAQYASKALEAKEIVLHDDMDETILFIWFCLMGIVEKSDLKADYIMHKLGKSREEFLEFAFNKLFTFLER